MSGIHFSCDFWRTSEMTIGFFSPSRIFLRIGDIQHGRSTSRHHFKNSKRCYNWAIMLSGN